VSSRYFNFAIKRAQHGISPALAPRTSLSVERQIGSTRYGSWMKKQIVTTSHAPIRRCKAKA
jgi:hypothetical protein